MSEPRPRRPIGPAVLAVVLAFLVTVAWQDQRGVAAREAERRLRLAEVIEARQARAAGLEQRLTQLREQAAAAAARSSTRALRDVQRRTEAITALSGAQALGGPGLRVTLSDATDANRASPDSSTRIQDVDIQAVVNTLWIAGAEAIAINGQRLVSTTAIRNAGAAVLVNFRVLTSPYQVEALGAADALRSGFEDSDIAAHFRRWREIYGLGFTVSTQDRLLLPAFGGSLRFRHAEPIASPTKGKG